MSRSSTCLLQASLTPFLYPFSRAELTQAARFARRTLRPEQTHQCLRLKGTSAFPTAVDDLDNERSAHLNPPPDSYSATPFTDHCTITITAGGGGSGCVSFLREKYVPNGPPNGGDGGTGGNIYIQAVRGETSLHKVARRRVLNAGRGKNGQGSNKNGQKGADIIISVPVGTVVRELARHDPVTVEEQEFLEEAFEQRRRRKVENVRKEKHRQQELGNLSAEEEIEAPEELDPLSLFGPMRREKWLMYPGEDTSKLLTHELPPMPKPRRSNLSGLAPEAPIKLDLDEHMETPILLAAGAMGGHGNPHFVSRDEPRPKVATKGDGGVKIMIHMELKLLADVGLVGLPNAGKSTLLRALSNSRARVGNWAFTTLQPNIGTVVLDDYKGRSQLQALGRNSGRTRFTIADIPGVIEDAHMDKGLGLSFLRHIERARVLAFVIDLNAGDAVTALKALWNEVSEYESLGGAKGLADDSGVVEWQPSELSPALVEAEDEDAFTYKAEDAKNLPPLHLPPMTSKPWFVVATKADLPDTKQNFLDLQRYLDGVASGEIEHPSKKDYAWKRRLQAVPVSGIRGEGVESIPPLLVELLDEW